MRTPPRYITTAEAGRGCGAVAKTGLLVTSERGEMVEPWQLTQRSAS